MKFTGIWDKTIIKFALVGIVNTIFGTFIMLLLYNVFAWSYWTASMANYILGSILSYFLNKNFTFKNREKGSAVILRFIINIVVCYFIAYGVAKPLVIKLCAGLSKNWQENIAMLTGMCFFMVLNYLGQRFFSFKSK